MSAITFEPVSCGRVTEKAYGIRRTSLPRRRTTKPKLSPCGEPPAARATICTIAEPPGVSVNGAASIVAPSDATCGLISTDQVPAPFPASDTVIGIVRLAPPELTSRYPNESDCGSVKTRGRSAAPTLTSPAPSTSTEDSWVSAESANAGPAVDISADFICFAFHSGCRWSRSAAAPATCGAEKLVPAMTAYGSPANSGSVEEMISAPGAVTSGFSACPKGVRPPAEKLVGTPAQLVGTSSTSRVNRTCAAPPAPAIAVRSRDPSRSEIVPPERRLKSANVGSPPLFSAITIPTAPAFPAIVSFAA